MRKVLFLSGLLLSVTVGVFFVAQTSSMVAAQTGEMPESSCLNCHSNEALLQELAEEEVVVQVANEGSG